jgi:hypothetical protein
MTAVLEIPTRAAPLIFTVMLEGVTYSIQQYWLVPAQCWVWNISDNSGNLLIGGVPLITGTDLLGQFSDYVGPPGQLLVISDPGPPGTVPGYTSLGQTGHVYYVPAAQPPGG